MEIRLFREDDAEDVSKLVRRTVLEEKEFSEKVGKHLWDKFTPDYFVDRSSAGRDIYVAIENEEIVGTAGVEGKYIGAVYVLPEKQGKGIGSRLMDVLEKRAREKGEEEVELYAFSNSEKFYMDREYIVVEKQSSSEYGNTKKLVKKL